MNLNRYINCPNTLWPKASKPATQKKVALNPKPKELQDSEASGRQGLRMSWGVGFSFLLFKGPFFVSVDYAGFRV